MPNIILIGDELHYEGQLIAIVVNGAIGGTMMGDFIDFVDTLIHYEETIADAKIEEGSAAVEKVVASLKLKAKGGLLRLPDVIDIIEDLTTGDES